MTKFLFYVTKTASYLVVVGVEIAVYLAAGAIVAYAIGTSTGIELRWWVPGVLACAATAAIGTLAHSASLSWHRGRHKAQAESLQREMQRATRLLQDNPQVATLLTQSQQPKPAPVPESTGSQGQYL